GHTEAPAALVATSRALSGVTHLFNAMPPISARAPGPAGAALVSDRLYAGIIADGHHVDPHNLALAARLMQDRLILVSDAMPTVGHDSTGFTLAGRRIALQGGRLTAEDGTLAGAHLTLDRAVRTMVAQASVPVGLALRMVSGVPARVLGLERELGRIAPGYRASLTCLSQDLRTIRVIVDGHPHDG
ncbi:MAG: amidohydrolase family protein, partial [Gemmobacter sp.]